MGQLDNGTLFIKTNYLEETAEHISRLSIRCMLSGEQYYKVGHHDHLVRPDNFLVINQGQSYKTCFKGSNEPEMLMVAFNPDFAGNVLYCLEHQDDFLLDNPFPERSEQFSFFEQTYSNDETISAVFSRLRMLIDEKDEAYKSQLDLNSYYAMLLERLFLIRKGIDRRLDGSGVKKESTRKELYYRIGIAKEYMRSNIPEKHSLEALSRIACMSPHHFLRSFKRLEGCTPHQYSTHIKLGQAKQLLDTTSQTVKAISNQVGFENESSFIRLFREKTGMTPEHYRVQQKH